MDRNPKATIATALLLACAVWGPTPARAEGEGAATLAVEADRSVFLGLPAGARTIAVGNPAIADALIAGETIVLTGKSTGSTNLLAADAQGNLLLSVEIAVTPASRGVVRVYSGTRRDVFHCAPLCEPVAAGDASNSRISPQPVRLSGNDGGRANAEQ